MSRYSDQIRDEYGRTVPKVSIYVYKWDAYAQVAGDLETLTDDLSAPLGNPLTSDPDGLYYFNSADGQKLLEYHFGGKVQERSVILVGALPVPQAVFGGLLTNASALTIPTGMDMIGTDGADALDHGGANYVAGTAPTARSGFTSANSRNFVLSKEQVITPQMFYQATDPDQGTSVREALSYLSASALTGFGYGSGTAPLAISARSSLYQMGSTPIDLTFTTRITGESGTLPGGWSTALKWGANSHGFRFQFYNTSGDTATGSGVRGAGGSVVEGVVVDGAYNGSNEGEYHGFFLRSSVALRDVQAWNFQGDGIRIHAATGLPEYGNANCWEINKAWIEGVRNGVNIDGSDSNQGICSGVSVSGARQWGFYDFSGISNLYIGTLTQLCGVSTNDGTTGSPVSIVANVAGTFRFAVIVGQEAAASTNAPPTTAVDDAHWLYQEPGGATTGCPTWFSGVSLRAGGPYCIAGGVILHGYQEGSQLPSQLGGSTLRIGGTWEGRVIGGAYLYAGANQVIVNDLRSTGGLSFDDDALGTLMVGRYNSGSPGFIKVSSAASSLDIHAPDNSNGVSIANAGVSIPKPLAIGGGTAITKIVAYTPSITPASVAAAVVAEQTFTVTGLTTADKVIVNPPAISNATGIAGARVSAADTLAIRFVNPTAGALTPSSGTYTVMAFRS